MCGIIGIVSANAIQEQLIESLKKLEYRGYDSAGIATIENGEFLVTKTAGKICELEKKLKTDLHYGNIGIGHTRWATHGKATMQNSHPFESENLCLVHNGIIENFKEIKINFNLKTVSQTDSEIILRLLEKNLNENKYLNINILIKTCNTLIGSYSLAILDKKQNKLFLAKNKSPLYVVQTNNKTICSSDIICFDNNELYFDMEDNEYCEIYLNKIIFYNKIGEIINKTAKKILLLNNTTTKNNYNYFMEKEIYETKNVLQNIYDYYFDDNYCIKKNVFEYLNNDCKNLLKNCLFKDVKLIGCGTACHSAKFGERFFENCCNLESRTFVASEFKNSILNEKSLCVFVSQSGETADTILALEFAKSKHCFCVAITNCLHSKIAKMADMVLPILAGPEIAVASTKAYSAQIAVLQIFAKYLSDNNEIEFAQNFNNFVQNFEISNKNIFNKITDFIDNNSICFILGKGEDFITAEEASLKIKEIAYINCLALPAGELKHGTLALIDDKTPVIIICTNNSYVSKCKSTKEEIEARGGKVLFVSQFETEPLLQNFDHEFMPIPSIIPFQLSALKLSVLKGLNPDQPRNLAKSVTVE
ncbi:MAG: glutamine--fructose-6-phosphate transaminase (isomerizing) [Clostridia bacterium]